MIVRLNRPIRSQTRTDVGVFFISPKPLMSETYRGAEILILIIGISRRLWPKLLHRQVRRWSYPARPGQYLN